MLLLTFKPQISLSQLKSKIVRTWHTKESCRIFLQAAAITRCLELFWTAITYLITTNKILWYNSYIKIDNYVVLINKFFENGISFLMQLFDENGVIKIITDYRTSLT